MIDGNFILHWMIPVLRGVRRVSRSKSATGVSRVLRDAMFPVLMRKFSTPGSFDWLYDHRIPLDDRIPADLAA